MSFPQVIRPVFGENRGSKREMSVCVCWGVCVGWGGGGGGAQCIARRHLLKGQMEDTPHVTFAVFTVLQTVCPLLPWMRSVADAAEEILTP